MFLVENVIRSALRKSIDRPLNILLIADEHSAKYISLICQTENNFYWWAHEGQSWKNEIERKPKNLQVINEDWPTSYLDMIICNDRIEQYNIAASLAHRFHLPIVLIDHCSGHSIKPIHVFAEVGVDFPQRLHKNPSATISTSEHISLSWPTGKLRLIIPPSIDTEKFCIPDIRPPDKGFGENLTERRVTFDNTTPPQIGEAIFGAFGDKEHTVIPTDSDIWEKERIYRQGDYFINPQNHVTVKMLEAMACGNIPICFAKPDLVQFIENGVDGFIVKDVSEIQSVLTHLDELSEEERSNISQNARKKIISSQLTTEDFISKWTSVFNYMKSQYYTTEV